MNKYILPLLFLTTNLFASENQITPAVSFGGGLNIKTAASDIEDVESPDMSNMINDIYGASMKRGGSRRYIDQSASSTPVTAVFKAYAQDSNVTKESLFMATGNKIYMSTGDTNPVWKEIADEMSFGQHYEFIIADNKAIITGDSLNDGIKQVNIVTQSTATAFISVDASSVVFKGNAKHLAYYKNYLILGNLRDLSDGSTYFPSRITYSEILDISSYPKTNIINIDKDDGEEITRMWVQNGYLLISKQSSIFELSATILDPDAAVGDQAWVPLVKGYGVLASRTLATDGYISFFLAKDGIRMFNNGIDNRELAFQSKIISTKIDPIIKDIIDNRTYDQCSAVLYEKKHWYVFSYIDTNKFPNDKPNSIIIYDLINDSWFPFEGWHADSLGNSDGITDDGELIYGDSHDGYVYLADLNENKNDARKELIIDNMDYESSWTNGVHDNTYVKEGTASVKFVMPGSAKVSSITNMGVYNFGEWEDKERVTSNDLFSFKVHITSPQNIAEIRVDLEVSNTAGADFDLNYTSVTFSSTALTTGYNTWTTLEFALSSFTILDEWVLGSTPTFPFSDSLTFFGVRVVVDSIGMSTVSIDDMRIVQEKENPIYAYRYTKQFDFGSTVNKQFLSVILSVEQPSNSRFAIDTFNNFGEYNKTEVKDRDYDNVLYVTGWDGTENISKVSSVDYELESSSISGDRTVWAIRPFVVDDDILWGGDQYYNRIMKMNITDLENTVFISSYGSLGSETTNFNGIYQIAQDKDSSSPEKENIYICDFLNHRVQSYNKETDNFVISYSSNLLCPNGVAVDGRFVYVSNEGNGEITIYDKKTADIVNSFKFNVNAIAGASLAVDEKYLFLAYKRVSSFDDEHYDLILEKRLKSPDYNLLTSKKIIPLSGSDTDLTTSTTLGDITISGDFIYIPFTTDANSFDNNYIHKLLGEDLSLVKEYSSTEVLFSLYHPSQSFAPRRKQVESNIGLFGRYLQIKFYIDGLDNTFKLYNHAYKIIPTEAL